MKQKKPAVRSQKKPDRNSRRLKRDLDTLSGTALVAKVLKQKSKPALKPGFTICTRCDRQYKIGMPHAMFCPANTCEECGNSYPGGVPKNGEGRRICQRCQSGEE